MSPAKLQEADLTGPLEAWVSVGHPKFLSPSPTSSPEAAALVVGAYLALLSTSLGLQGAGAALHALGEAEVAAVGAVVEVSQPRQGQDVVTGDPQDGQFGQLLAI